MAQTIWVHAKEQSGWKSIWKIVCKKKEIRRSETNLKCHGIIFFDSFGALLEYVKFYTLKW